MGKGRLAALAAVVVLVCASGAAAQDTSTVGVTMGYPAAFGMIWHVGDKLAIRPELTFTGSSSRTEQGNGIVAIEGDGFAIGTGVSALIYLHKYDRLRTYFSPRFTYTHTRTTTKPSSTLGSLVSESTSKSNAYGGVGSFGAEAAVTDKFSLFGEVGVGVTRSTGSSTPGTIKPTSTSWGTRAGVGVIFYL